MSFPESELSIWKILSKVQRTIVAIIHLFVKMSDHIHIVYIKSSNLSISGNQPDFLYMLRSLFQIGKKIHLHCFFPERVNIDLVANMCEEITTYCSLTNPDAEYFHTEKSEIKRLIKRLVQDDIPILCHGYPAASIIHKYFHAEKRKFAFRLLRNEPTYLNNLATVTPWGLKKIRFLIAALMVKLRFNKVTQHARIGSSVVLGGSSAMSKFIPEFKGPSSSFFKEGKGSFCLYHGDLSKRENEFAAQWLLEHVFNDLEIPFVIAGKSPSLSLEQAAHVRMHTCLVSNPSEMEMSELIKKAQLILLPSFIEEQGNIDILESLMLGRHILLNEKAAHGNPYSLYAEIAESPESFKEKTEILFNTPFQEKDKLKRLEGIEKMESDELKAMELISLLS
jgi:hypothetical protein